MPGQDPASAAAQVGLRPGDTITGFAGRPVSEWGDLTERIRAAGGTTTTLTWERDGQTHTAEVVLPAAQRLRSDIDPSTKISEVTEADLEQVGVLGITPVIPQVVHGPIAGVGEAASQTAFMFEGTVGPGGCRSGCPSWSRRSSVESGIRLPVSLVGASVIGGSLFARGDPHLPGALAALNFFVGVFNCCRCCPWTAAHRHRLAREGPPWLYALGSADPPGRHYKLMPVTYVVILIMAAFPAHRDRGHRQPDPAAVLG